MNIVDPLHEHARRTPSRAAVVHPGGTLTWAQLDRALCSGADFLHARGIRPGARVGLTIRAPIAHLVASLALARIGASHVALSATDPPAVRRESAAFLGLTHVVGDADDADLPGVACVRFAPVGDAAPGSSEPSPPTPRVDGDASAAWLFLKSSGTTGAPKFAELSHAISFERSARYRAGYGYRDGDVFWTGVGAAFITPKQHFLSALQAGVTICVSEGLGISRALVAFLRASHVTLAYATPSQMWELIDACEGGPALDGIRVFMSGTTTVSRELREAFGAQVCPNLYVNYGTNEAPALSIASPALLARIPDAVGVPSGSVELQIVDGEGRALAPGETGEIRVRGTGVVRAYFSNPDATAKSFRDGWFHPGDLGFLTVDGALVLQGRVDDMMIFDGVNIFPAEIERVLGAHPAVREAAAYPIAHPRFGDVPAAAVTLSAPATEAELIRWCEARLGVKHPRKIRVVQDFPRNSIGKIVKRALSTSA
ncbi:MAG: class I adenylate-forming enzyme family protein [Burkholderiaceae bacterium]